VTAAAYTKPKASTGLVSRLSGVNRFWTALTSWASPLAATLAWLAIVAVAMVVIWREPTGVALAAVLALLLAAWALRVTVGQLHVQEKREADRARHEAVIEDLLGSIDRRVEQIAATLSLRTDDN
jgi:hypothetical protein